MKFNKKYILIIILLIPFIIFFYKVILGSLFSINNTILDSKSKVMRYLKSNYKNESFEVKDKTIEKIENDSNCGSYDEYTWIVSSNNSSIEFEVISGYRYGGVFVCQKYNHDTYKNKVIDEIISNKSYINISRNGYGDISFNQNELSDEEFINAIYNTIVDLRTEYPFKDNNVSIEVDIFMNNGTKKYLKLKDITSLSYLKNILK